MLRSYIMRQDQDQSWSVLVDDTGIPVRLAGIPQTGLKLIEAEILMDLLTQGTPSAPETPRQPAYLFARDRSAA